MADVSANVVNNAEAENFFQSDASLLAQYRRQIKANKRVQPGRPIACPSKVLAIAAEPSQFPNQIWTAESGFLARCVDLSTGKAVRSFKEGHTGPITCLALPCDSNGEITTLYTGSWDKTIARWSIASGERTQVLRGHSDFVKCLRPHPFAGTLYSGSADATIREWDLATGTCRAIFKGHRRGVEDLTFSEDGQKMYTVGSDGAILIWDLTERLAGPTTDARPKEIKLCQRFPDASHETSIYKCLVVDGSLYTASADKTVKRWDLETLACECTFKHPDWVKSMAISGSHLMTGSRDEIIRVWDIGTEECVRVFKGHYGEVSDLLMLGDQLISGSLDTTIRRWHLSDAEEELFEEEEEEAVQAAAQWMKDGAIVEDKKTASTDSGIASSEEAPDKNNNGMTAEEEAELDALMED